MFFSSTLSRFVSAVQITLSHEQSRRGFPLQDAENIVTKIKQQQYHDLLSRDQLGMERNDGRVFLHFGEFCWVRTHRRRAAAGPALKQQI